MSSHIISPFPEKKLSAGEVVEKGTNLLNDIEDPVVTIYRKDLNNFKGYLQHQQFVLIMITSGFKNVFLHLNRTSI